MIEKTTGQVKELKEFRDILDKLESEITNYSNIEDSICDKLHQITQRDSDEGFNEPKSGTAEIDTVVHDLKIAIERLKNINERLMKDERHLNQLV